MTRGSRYFYKKTSTGLPRYQPFFSHNAAISSKTPKSSTPLYSMKPSFILTVAAALFAGQTIACSNGGDACDPSQKNELACSCGHAAHIVSQPFVPFWSWIDSRSRIVALIVTEMGNTIGGWMRLARAVNTVLTRSVLCRLHSKLGYGRSMDCCIYSSNVDLERSE